MINYPLINNFMASFKFIHRLKSFLKPFYFPFYNSLNFLWDLRLKSVKTVKESGEKIFKVYDYGQLVRYRANSFERKEPETLNWIRGFDTNDYLLDIGANIGIYSLYAAYKGINVIAVEPDALNYALLNLNIRLNDFGKQILPYCIAIHDKSKFSNFNIGKNYKWGGAMNSFDNILNYKGEEFVPVHSQGVFGIDLDSFLNNLPSVPNHLKIDVDGNENLILMGAKELLKNKTLKSILIELDETREDYESSKTLIQQSGFKLIKKTHAEMYNQGKYSSTYNHIFKR